MRSSVALARRRPPLASKPGTDEMVIREKAFEIFVSLSYIVHRPQFPFRLEQMERLELLERFQ